MKQRILIYCTQLMPSGGIEYYILEFCKNMSAHFDLDIVVANFCMPQHKELLKKYCHNIFLIKPGASWKRHIHLLKNLVSLRKTKYDILYTNGIGTSVLFVGKIVHYKKWVLHHHMAADDDFFATLDAKYKKAMLLADHVIACSNINADNLCRLLNRNIDVVFYFSRDLSNSVRHKIESSRFQFGYYGRLIHAKGIDLICKLSEDADCRHIAFHIWGSGSEYPASFFKEYPYIFYHGSFNTKEELCEVANTLDAFLLLTTHSEGLPISLLEMMSAGIPWISTYKGGIPDIACDPSSTRIIDVSNYELVKQSVLQLANDIQKGNVLRDKQMMLYQKKFSADVLVDNWKSVYNT